VKPVRALASDRAVVVRCYLDGPVDRPVTITAELRDSDRALNTATAPVNSAAQYPDLTIENIGDIQVWDLQHPKLYQVAVRCSSTNDSGDALSARIGFREARFTERCFYLNGQHVKLRGLNRHQTFPYTGCAMPNRVQARDALVLRNELKCNIVRTSHYPGVENTGRMIRRDWNYPSIVLWGVRINESADDHDFYTRTNSVAHSLDDSRQTGGIRDRYDSELLEDVLTMNDFGFPLRLPNHPAYLNTEFNGHMVLYQTLRQCGTHRRTRRAARARTRPTGIGRTLRWRYRLGRFRLRVAPLFRLRRPHLLSRRERHLSVCRNPPRDSTSRSAIRMRKW
jgi:beta-galactosidase